MSSDRVRERLPPWPLGAKYAVDHDFRKACLENHGLIHLMRMQPEAAAEVLLALIIEDKPEREYGSDRYQIEPKLGLEWAHAAYPTAFWKSPFFQFLYIAPEIALKAAIALVNFCTERWLEEVMRRRNGQGPGITLQLADGTMKKFVGWWQIFNWIPENSSQNGNLFCTLDALERWLTLRLDGGADISAEINQILRESSSIAFLGLLVNVGKYHPALFAGVLAPLLSEPHLFYWDNARVEHLGFKFDGLNWRRSGDEIFKLAQDWTLAPHRQRTLLATATDLLKTDQIVAERLKSLIPSWSLPDAPKTALEFKLIFAALDRDNYQPTRDGNSGEEAISLIYPEELSEQVQQWNDQHAKPLQYLLIPSECEKVLQRQQAIDDEAAAQLYELLQLCESDDAAEPDVKRRCMLALAAALVMSADAWLAKRPSARQKAFSTLKEAILEIGGTAEAIRDRRMGMLHEDMKFAAYGAMHIWMTHEAESPEWEGLVLRLLSSGNSQAAGVIFGLADAYRHKLGSSWWRLLLAGILWSGLVRLSPRYGDDEQVERTWNLWLERFRRFSLRRDGASADDLRLARISEGSERLEFERLMRAYHAGDRQYLGKPTRSRGDGLDTHFLSIVFHWLINGTGTGDWAEDSRLIGDLWAYEIGRAREEAKDDGEYALPSQQFGYDILIKLAESFARCAKRQSADSLGACAIAWSSSTFCYPALRSWPFR